MDIYIEYVILDNLIIDYLLLNLVGITFKKKYKFGNKLFGSIIGTVSAIVFPFLYKFKLLIIIYKVLTAMLMILILYKYRTFRDYFKCLLVFIAYTFLFGGIILGILNLSGVEYSISGVILYNCEIPISLIIIILYLSYFVIKNMLVSLSKQLRQNNYMYEIKIVDNGKIVNAVGFYDSGNKVSRDKTGVNIISIDLFLKLYNDYSIEKFLFKNIDESKLKEAKYINIESLSKGSKFLSFVVDKIIINNCEIEKPVVAVAVKNFNDFDCILNSQIMAEGL